MDALRCVDPLVADNIEKALAEVFPDMARIAIEFGYGDVMSRPGLDLRTRELLNVAMLGAMGTASEQLQMHVRGALNTGATQAQILEVVLQIAAYAGFPAAFNALGCARKIFEAQTKPEA
jgi:4-carboxymuconolactone decarboxylase